MSARITPETAIGIVVGLLLALVAGADLLRARHVHIRLPQRTRSIDGGIQEILRPTMSAFEAAEKNGRAADLQKELEDLLRAKTKARGRMPRPFPRPSCA